MSMSDFVKTLTDEQRAALLKALTGDNSKGEVIEEPLNTHPPFIDTNRWQHEEPVSEAVDGDFTMHKDNQSRLGTDKRRLPVKARENKFVDDASEHSDITTPNAKVTPRNRKPPVMKQVVCHVCGKKNKVNSELLYGEYYRCDRCIG